MQNYDIFLELREEFANGEQFNSAVRENQRYVDSLRGRLNELKTVWTDIATTILGGETLKNGVSTLTNISEVIASFVKATESVGMTIPFILGVVSAFKTLGRTMSIIKKGKEFIPIWTRIGNTVNDFRTSVQGTTGVMNRCRAGLTSLGSSLGLVGLKQKATALASSALQGALVGLVMYGISRAIQWLIDMKNELKDTHEELQATVETTKSDTANLRENAKSISKIADEYDTLASKTKLTNEEYERFNELKQEVADLFPELVSGYDENQNPILALTGSLKDYQEQLQETIKEQERLTKNQENALGNAGTKRANEIKQKLKQLDTSLLPDNERILSNSFMDSSGKLKSFQDGLAQYEKYLLRRDELTTEYNKKIAEQNEELLQIDEEVQTQVLNKLKDDFYYKNYDKLSEQAKGSMQQLVENFNWVSDVTLTSGGKSNFIKAFDDLSKEMKGRGAEINNWNNTLREANAIYQQTGDIEKYKEQIGEVADKLAEITDISKEDWIIGLTPELIGNLDAGRAALQDYLDTLGYTYQDYVDGSNGVVEKQVVVEIVEQWNNNSMLLQELASFEGDKEEIISFIIGMRENGSMDNLSPQAQAILNGILDDGKDITDQELNIALNLITKMNSLGNFDKENSELMSKILNGKATDEELNVGIKINGQMVLTPEMARWLNNKNSGQNVEYDVKLEPNVVNKEEVNKQLEEQLSKFTNINERDRVKQLFIEGKITGIENMELFESLIRALPTNSEYTIKFLEENYSDLDGMTLTQALDWIKQQGDSFTTRYGLTVDGVEECKTGAKEVEDAVSEIGDSVEEVNDSVDELNSNEATVTVNEGQLQGTVEDYKKLIEYSTKLEDGKYKISFVTDTENAIDQMETLVQSINNISTAFQDIPDLKIVIDIADASQDLDNLNNKVDDFVNKVSTVNTTSFVTEISNAATNVETLEEKIDTYVSKYSDKEFKTNFVANTETAYTNVDNLENKISDYVSNYAGKTYTTTFQVIKQSLGNGGSNNSQGPLSTPTLARDISTNPFETEVGIAPTSVSVDNSNLSTMVNTAIPTVSAKANLGIGEIGVNTTIPTKINTSIKNILDSIEYGVELFQELQNRIDKVNNKLTLLDTKMQRAVGTKKLEYLEKQNALYEEQKKLQEELYDNLYKEKDALKGTLKDYGFTFDAQGNLRSYEEKLLAMERKAKQLEEAAEKASEKASNYETKRSSIDTSKYDTSKYNTTGKNLTKAEKAEMQKKKEAVIQAKKNAQAKAKAEAEASEKVKKSLESQADKAKEVSDNYKEKLDKVKNLTQEYLDLHNSELPSVSNEWEELNNKIAENNDEIEKLIRENKLYIYKNSTTELGNQIDILTDKYDLLDIKMKHALGNEKLSMYNQQIEIMQKQKKAQEELIENYNQMIEVYKTDLSDYGFKFDEDNNLINQKEILDSFQNSEDLEKVTELMEEYIDIQREQLPNAISEWENLENAIKDVYEAKLDITKEIEDKITEIYKDQIEKRKDEIQKQCDKEVEAINKVKEAYQKSKEEDTYEKNKAEQQQKIADINKQIDRYKKDNSTSAQAKLSDLLDQLKTEQENLDKLIEDRRDSLVSDMFDKQIERIQEESDKAQEKLDEEWTQDKIAEMVKNALDTGMFTSITGEITNLESVMLEFAETSGDAIGIMADKVKTELVGNLQAAMDIMKEYPSIMKGLNLGNIDTASLDISKLGQNTVNKSVNVGDINISVTGNGNPTDIANEVKKQVSECFDDLISRV